MKQVINKVICDCCEKQVVDAKEGVEVQIKGKNRGNYDLCPDCVKRLLVFLAGSKKDKN